MKDNKLIDFMEQEQGEFVSGEWLSERLNCSRTAVWKQIQQLKKRGYQFEASSRLGYRLIGRPERISTTLLQSLLKTKTMGRNIRYFDEVSSTQASAQQWFAEGAEEGSLVIAEHQTSGRGRLGRTWHSPMGKGIWMSFILTPAISVQFASQLTLLTSVALCRVLNRLYAIDAGIKWPNDILVQGKKLCGILLESSTEDERIKVVIAGIGISANLEAKDYPDELQQIATSISMLKGQSIEREQLIADFLLEFEQLYELYLREGFSPIRTLWETLSVSLHHLIRIQTGGGFVEGVADHIDDHGALQVIQRDGKSMKIFSGEIQ